MEKLFIRRVESNIKGGVDLTLDQPHALIIGDNEAGKSAITDAIFLALTERVPDLSGRSEVARSADIMALAPGREGELFAKVWIGSATTPLEDCFVVSYETSGKEGRAKRPTHTVPDEVSALLAPEACLPLRDLRSLFSGSSVDRRREFFFGHVCRQLKSNEVLDQIPDRYREDMEHLASLVGVDTYSANALIKIRTRASEELQTAKKHLAQAETVLAATQDVVDSPPAPNDIESAEVTLAHLQSVLTRLPTSEPIETNRNELAQLQEQCASQGSQLESIANEGRLLDQRKQLALEQSRRLDALAFVARVQADELSNGGMDSCAVCSQEVDVIRAQEFAQKVSELAARQVKGWSDHDEQQLVALRDQYRKCQRTLLVNQSRIDEMTKRLSVEVESRQAQDQLYREAGVESVEEAQNKVVRISAHLERMKGALRQYDRVKQARDRKHQYQADVDHYGRLVTVLNETIAALLERSVSAFESQVSAFLPKDDVFRLFLWEGSGKKRKSICLIGLERDGVFHTALSGAAWSRVTMAIACVLSMPLPVAVIIPEERAYDPKTLRATMAALKDAPAQVLITHPTKHAGRTPAKWSVVEVQR